MSPLGPSAAARIHSARRLLTTTWFDMMLPGGALYPANGVGVGFAAALAAAVAVVVQRRDVEVRARQRHSLGGCGSETVRARSTKLLRVCVVLTMDTGIADGGACATSTALTVVVGWSECGVYRAWSAPAPQSSTPASAVSGLALQSNIARGQPSPAIALAKAPVFSMVPPRLRVPPSQFSRAGILVLAPDNRSVGLCLQCPALARLSLESCCVLAYRVLIS